MTIHLHSDNRQVVIEIRLLFVLDNVVYKMRRHSIYRVHFLHCRINDIKQKKHQLQSPTPRL